MCDKSGPQRSVGFGGHVVEFIERELEPLLRFVDVVEGRVDMTRVGRRDER